MPEDRGRRTATRNGCFPAASAATIPARVLDLPFGHCSPLRCRDDGGSVEETDTVLDIAPPLACFLTNADIQIRSITYESLPPFPNAVSSAKWEF